MNIGSNLFHPVETGEARVKNAVFDVSRHFLRANQHALHFGIVDGGKIRTRTGRDVEPGAAEKFDSGILQAAFRNAKL